MKLDPDSAPPRPIRHRRSAPRPRWHDLSRSRRGAMIALGAAQVSLAAGAWWDLARRPAAAVNGPKSLWALVIAVNFVGPLAYLRFGRRPVPLDLPAG